MLVAPVYTLIEGILPVLTSPLYRVSLWANKLLAQPFTPTSPAAATGLDGCHALGPPGQSISSWPLSSGGT